MVKISDKPRFRTYYTVVFEKPSKKSGKMIREVSSYVDDLKSFRARIEKRGGRIIKESAPRQVETFAVYL